MKLIDLIKAGYEVRFMPYTCPDRNCLMVDVSLGKHNKWANKIMSSHLLETYSRDFDLQYNLLRELYDKLNDDLGYGDIDFMKIFKKRKA